MPFVVGGYTEIGFGTPPALCERVLDSVLKPLLTMMYHRKETCFSLSLTGALIEWLETNHPEVNMLISDLVKKNQLFIIGGAYYQGILSLLSPKDRSAQIEKYTTAIRLTYGQRTDTFFCNAQIFSPYYLSTTSLCGIKNLLITPCGDNCMVYGEEPFVMQEQDKKINVLPIDEKAALLTSQYADGLLSFLQYQKELWETITLHKNKVLFLNFDQLCKGGVSSNDMEQLFGQIFSQKSCFPDDFGLIRKKGYQCDGWYGYDAAKVGGSCFNGLFVQDESLSYLYNRYVSFMEISKAHKKSKDVKKQMEKLLLSCGIGNPYVMDATLSMVRPSVRQWFYHRLTEAELLFDSTLPAVYDVDRDGRNEHVYLGKNFLTVLSPLGGSLSEVMHLPSMTNFGGAFIPLAECGSCVTKHTGKPGSMMRLFSDVICTDPLQFSYERDVVDTVYDIDDSLSEKGEFCVMGHQGDLSITKHFKYRQNTILVDVSVKNCGKGSKCLWYGLSLPLSLSPPKDADSISCSVTDGNHKSHACLERSVFLDDIRSIRFFVGDTLTVFSAESCGLLKEDHVFKAKSMIGDETILLDVLSILFYPMNLKEGASFTMTAGLRIEKK